MFPQKTTNADQKYHGISIHNSDKNYSEPTDNLPIDVLEDENLCEVQHEWDTVNDLSRNKIRDGFENRHKLIQYSQDMVFQVHV